MATPPPVTDTLARFVTENDFAVISQNARTQAKLHILDTLGVALAGATTPAAEIAAEFSRRNGFGSDATIWGHPSKATVPMAAFANGLQAHALDYDDWDGFIHLGHPSSMIVGAALSLGEHLSASGKDLLQAYILGIEIAAKLSSSGPNIQRRGFHSTPIWGGIGGTVACAKLLRLEREKLKCAFGIAASAVGGIQRQQGSMAKPFHAANGARIGAEAALLASAGFTADPAIFEAPRGFCDTFIGPNECDFEKMITAVGDPYFLDTPGLGLKWHPCSAPQFLAADAALHLKHAHKIDFADVANMAVSIPPQRYQRHYHAEVKTGLRGKFAINYVVALCFLDGKLEIATFTDEKANQPQVQAALGKVKVIVDETIPEPGPYCPVSVELNSGQRFSYTAKIAKGDPRNPMTEEEVLGKFRSNAKTVVSSEAADRLVASVMQLETVANVTEIVALLTPER